MSHLDIIPFDDRSWIQVVLHKYVRILLQFLSPFRVRRFWRRRISVVAVDRVWEIDLFRAGLIANFSLILL